MPPRRPPKRYSAGIYGGISWDSASTAIIRKIRRRRGLSTRLKTAALMWRLSGGHWPVITPNGPRSRSTLCRYRRVSTCRFCLSSMTLRLAYGAKTRRCVMRSNPSWIERSRRSDEFWTTTEFPVCKAAVLAALLLLTSCSREQRNLQEPPRNRELPRRTTESELYPAGPSLHKMPITGTYEGNAFAISEGQ